MDAQNKIVNSLWIGNKLSIIELLTIHSFIEKGHEFRLWVYEPLQNELPAGVVLLDAAEIVPKERVFAYRNENKYGHGKGSVAGFSDIFRYKLLYEKGGWWVDMDVTCLQPLDFKEEYFFRSHHELQVVGNVMKCPPQSALMKSCYEEAIESVDEHNTDWHKPIEILNKYVADLGLTGYIQQNVSNHDQWDKTNRFIRHTDKFPVEWYFIHWQNEEWRSRAIDKKDFYYKSILAKLLDKYGLYAIPPSLVGKLKNVIRHSPYFDKRYLSLIRAKV